MAIGIVPLSISLVIKQNESSGRFSNSKITNCCNLDYSRFAFTFSRNFKPPGVYVLSNFCGNGDIKADAYCDTINGGGGWLVVQRRQGGSVDFNRNWFKYENGFGKLTGEFWCGLRALHCLTGQGSWEMRMDIKYEYGRSVFLHYEQFKVASAKDKYKLTVGGFHAGDHQLESSGKAQ